MKKTQQIEMEITTGGDVILYPNAEQAKALEEAGLKHTLQVHSSAAHNRQGNIEVVVIEDMSKYTVKIGAK